MSVEVVRPGAKISSASVGHERLPKKSDAPCPLGAELSATGLPPAIPRAPGALTPRGFGTCQLPARTTRSRRPSPETSFLWVRSETARLTAGCRGVVFAGRPCRTTSARGGSRPSGACFGLGTCPSKALRKGSAAGVVTRSGSSQVVQPRGTSPRGVRLSQQSLVADGERGGCVPELQDPRPPSDPSDCGKKPRTLGFVVLLLVSASIAGSPPHAHQFPIPNLHFAICILQSPLPARCLPQVPRLTSPLLPLRGPSLQTPYAS
jgi:hypothetical protein